VSSLCIRAGISRQAYYKEHRYRHIRMLNEDLILKSVKEVRKEQGKLGGRKLLKLLSPDFYKMGISIGRDRLFDLLRREKLLIYKRRRRIRTTYSNHRFMKYPNLYKDVLVTGKNQVWVSDITYIKTYEGYLYLALITDVYSRKIVGYKVSDTLETVGCLEALKMAEKGLGESDNLIHHSDRGIQYCSHDYINRLKRLGAKISMTEVDHCAENALAERVNGILKDEYLLNTKFLRKKDAISSCHKAIRLYNEKRPHMSLNYQFPAEVYAA